MNKRGEIYISSFPQNHVLQGIILSVHDVKKLFKWTPVSSLDNDFSMESFSIWGA